MFLPSWEYVISEHGGILFALIMIIIIVRKMPYQKNAHLSSWSSSSEKCLIRKILIRKNLIRKMPEKYLIRKMPTWQWSLLVSITAMRGRGRRSTPRFSYKKIIILKLVFSYALIAMVIIIVPMTKYCNTCRWGSVTDTRSTIGLPTPSHFLIRRWESILGITKFRSRHLIVFFPDHFFSPAKLMINSEYQPGRPLHTGIWAAMGFSRIGFT